jgi:hypothetical protein
LPSTVEVWLVKKIFAVIVLQGKLGDTCFIDFTITLFFPKRRIDIFLEVLRGERR